MNGLGLRNYRQWAFFGMRSACRAGLLACLGVAAAFGQCTLNGAANPCVLNGPVTVNTSYNAGNDTITTGNGTITNNGTMNFTSAANNTFLNINGSLTLQGAGAVNLFETGTGSVVFQQSVGGVTLTNFDNLIQGAGIVGNGGLTLVNDVAGTIGANSSGQTLFLNGSGGITNQGILRGTNGGILQLLSVTTANAGGNITADGGTVQLSSSVINGGTLNSANGGTLETAPNGIATLNGVTISSGSTYTSGNNTDLFVSGTITNNGVIQVGAGANGAITGLNGDTTLTGGGTLTLSESGSGSAIVQQQVGGLTLTNHDNLIQGAGIIGNGGLTVSNEAGGTINANASGQTLFLDGSGGVANKGLLTATNGGTLEILSVTIANASSNITADGGAVRISSSTINGGTLNSLNGGTLQTIANGLATLNGVTLSAGSTYTAGNNTDLFVSGTLTNNGEIQVNAGANTTVLGLNSNTTLTGGGTVTLAEGGAGAAIIQQQVGSVTLENVNNTIHGAGVIGNGGLALLNDAAGTINADATGQTLFLNGSGGVTNNGLLTATNGGTLEILSTTVTNGGANITANGGAVVISSSTINGGTLNSLNGGTFQTIANGIATLNNVTLSNGTTYTTGNNTDLFVSGTITNNGAIQVNAAANTTVLGLNANTTLTGGGTVTLAESGGGAAILQQEVGNVTLENVNNTIQGAGVVGNGGLTLLNDAGGTVNANASSQTLFVDGSGGVINKGLFTATNNGTLEILSTTVNNSGGEITGNGGTVVVSSSTIQGGTLNGAFQTVTNGVATLDGSTHGAITLDSSALYTTGNNTDLFVTGTISGNGGNIQVNAGANNTILALIGNTTLNTGGSLTLSQSGGGVAFIQQEVGGLTLTNSSTVIQGAGIIGNGGLTVLNQSGGTILANAPGQTLTINGSGGLTNNGTLQVAAGSTMLVSANLTNFAGGTLTAGTYEVQGTAGLPGTLKITSLGNSGGEIVDNAATIVLDGPTAEITDNANKNALSQFQDNLADGSFTIENGQAFSTSPVNAGVPADFRNEGNVVVGANSSFTANGSGNYVQSGAGSGTTVAGELIAGGGAGSVNINGGVLAGGGGFAAGANQVLGKVNIGPDGTIAPGLGIIRIDGEYTQSGTFNEQIGSANLYSSIATFGNITSLNAGSTLDISLVNGFAPAGMEEFFILTADSNITGQFTNVNFLNNALGDTYSVDYSHEAEGEIILDINAPGGGTALPEPVQFLPLAGALTALIGWKMKRNLSRAA